MLPIFALFALMPPNIESYVIFIGPILTGIFLLAFPFISNKGERHPLRRPWAVFGAICVIVFVASLLVVGMRSPWSPNFKAQAITANNLQAEKKEAVIQKGIHLFYTKGCEYCHQMGDYGGKTGPELTRIGRTRTPEQITIRIVNGSDNMPAYGGMLKQDELHALTAFLSSRK
jgi:ubiquinol-cytochrome c reductase cytochrome b subunit